MQKLDDKGYIVLFEAPHVEKPEFRLYYDDSGNVITYTCEKLLGNYIVIDALTFAEARPDVRVIDGKITKKHPNMVVSKLMPSSDGQSCVIEDLTIVVDDEYKDKTIKWNMITYELD